MQNMDMNSWENRCLLYDKNHKGLNFEVETGFVDGKISIRFKNLDKKYIPTMEKIMICNAQGAVVYLYHAFDARYAFDGDYEEECKKNFSIMKENTELYIRTLFADGYDAFMELVQQQTGILQAQYMLSKVTYKDHQWQLPDGQVWNNGWEKDGAYQGYVLLDPMWESLLGTQEAQRKIA